MAAKADRMAEEAMDSVWLEDENGERHICQGIGSDAL